MKYLVVIVDDYGLCAGVNKGCLEAYQHGIVTELSLMMNHPGTEEAIHLAEKNKVESLGIHLTLSDYNQTEKYLRTTDYRKILVEEPADKLQAVAKKELSDFELLVGRSPSHITSQQHIHQHPKLVKMISNYASNHNIYVRRAVDFSFEENPVGDIERANEEYQRLGVKFPDYFFGHVKGEYEFVKTTFLKELETVEDNSVTELMFHPGYIDDFLVSHSSMTKERERDIKLAADEDF